MAAMYTRCVRLPLLTLVGCLVTACASTPGPQSLTIASSAYGETFDRAVTELRRTGYTPLVMDRETGLIETAPRHAGGLAEPWRTDNDSLEQAIHNTASHCRRRIRVEFSPAGFVAPAPRDPARLDGVPIPGSDADIKRYDMLTYNGSIEVRVWVSIERSSIAGNNLSTYTGSLASRWTDPSATSIETGDRATILDQTKWTAIGRDSRYESRILGLFEATKQVDITPNPG